MKESGFTFIEILVVMTIMAIFGTGIMLQQRFTKEDSALKNTAFELQSLVREAQSNATTSTLCEGVKAESWIIEPRQGFKNTIYLKCDDNPNPASAYVLQKTYNFANNIELNSVTTDVGVGCNPQFPAQLLDIIYLNLSSKPNFDAPLPCIRNSVTYLDFYIKNTKTNNLLIVRIDKGGSIDVR